MSDAAAGIPPGLLDEVKRRYGIAAEVESRLQGGYECDVLALASEAGGLVLRVCPAWRTVSELAWAYDLAAHAAAAIPEAVAPLEARDGSRVFDLGGRPVAVFPRVAGRRLDRDDADERDQAARLLARLHRVLPAWPVARPRPPNAREAERLAARDAIAEPEDAALDRFLAARAMDPRVRRVPLHGDVYRGNLLVDGGRIVGLIDWDDARVGSLEGELAWTVWELTQAAGGDGLDVARAERFLSVYAATGGPASTDLTLLVSLIRANLRREVREAARARAAGAMADEAYVARALRGFNALGGRA